MGFIAAGIAVAAIGAGVSAYGTAQNAAAQQAAAEEAARTQEALFQRQNDNLDTLIKQKENKLYNAGNIFDRFKSTGAFGDTTTLENLRKAQQDFSNLAAGDFSGFESQLKKSMSDALINTGQSGAPIGTFAGLAADQQMQFRELGIKEGVGITDFLSAQTNQLLGSEFGIMDQKFNTGYQLDRDRVLGVNASNQQAAAQEGVGTIAYGNAAQSIGSSIATYGMSNAGTSTTNAPRPQYGYNTSGQFTSIPSYGSPPSSYQQFQQYSRPSSVSSYAPSSSYTAQSNTNQQLPGYVPEQGSYNNPPEQYDGSVLPSRQVAQPYMNYSNAYSYTNGQGAYFPYQQANMYSSALSSVGSSIVSNNQ